MENTSSVNQIRKKSIMKRREDAEARNIDMLLLMFCLALGVSVILGSFYYNHNDTFKHPKEDLTTKPVD